MLSAFIIHALFICSLLSALREHDSAALTWGLVARCDVELANKNIFSDF